MHIRFEVETGPRANFTTPVLDGDLKVNPNKIVDATGWRRWLLNSWKPVTQSRVRQGLEGVRKLYQKENRLEARVALASMPFDPETMTSRPELNIIPGPRIEVRAMGAKISHKNLQRFVPVFEEHAVDQDLETEGARNLRDYLQSEGFFDASVDYREQRITDDRTAIDYLVTAGNRHKLVLIDITGNRFFPTAAIRERMLLQRSSFPLSRRGRYSESYLRRDEEAITALYQSNGFRDVRVTHRIDDEYMGRADHLAVFIHIDEGLQYFVGNLVVEGITQLDQTAIRARLSSIAGQPFSEFAVAVDRDTILDEYFRNGFPNATFEWSSKPSPESHRFDLRYVVNEGRRLGIREAVANGFRVTRPRLIYRTLKLNPGDPLSPTEIADAQRRLYDLGIFQKVDAAIQNPDGETADKYVVYQVEEAHRYSMAVGVGAELGRIGGCQTCLDTPGGTTGFSPRISFNITRNNMWGVAHSLSLRTRLSTLDKQALLTYQWPRFADNNKLSLAITGIYLDSRDVNTYSYKRAEASVQLSERISKDITIAYQYTFRRVVVDESTLKISPLLIPLLSQPVRLGLFSAALVQDRRDDPLDSHRGIYNTLDMGVAAKAFGSERSFLRFLARNSTYHPIGPRLVLARSTVFGDLYPFNYTGDPEQAIPLPERFYGGGSTTNRGFPDYQAGPRDLATGFPVGGNALLFNQTELRFPLLGESVRGVLFHDFGNVFTSLNDLSFRVTQHGLTDFDYMVHAVGFGVRYRTPVGPLRVDLAYSINPPSFFGFKGSQQDLINAGVNPCEVTPGVPSKCVEQNVSHFQFFFSIGQTF